jgi:hypothetical protein
MHGRKDMGECWKGPKTFLLRQQRCPKKSWMLEMIHVLVGENEITYSIINGSENDFMDDLYD